MSTTEPSVLVVQPYLAGYRVPFWERAQAACAARGVRCDLAFGEPTGEQSGRGDQAHLPHVPLRTRAVTVAGVQLRSQASWRHWRRYDTVVLELAGTLLDTNLARIGRRPFGLWGHVEAYTTSGSAIDAAVESWQLRRAGAVFAYTARGAAAAVERGAAPDRVFTLNNTVDLAAEIEARDAVSRAAAVASLGLDPGQTHVAFIGGLDSSKRLDFLTTVLDDLAERAPWIHLVVGGRGPGADLLRPAEQRGQVTMLGSVDTAAKAALGAACRALLMPGRVGLVAVDSFALALPVVTTDWPFHAPEFDYLSDGRDCLVTQDDPRAFADAVLRLAGDDDLHGRLSDACRDRRADFGLDVMVDAFVAGVERLVGRAPRPGPPSLRKDEKAHD